MTRIERSIEIDVPVSKVFAYASDYNNWASFFVGVSDFIPTSNVKRGNGSRFSYKVKLLGIKASVETEITEFNENVGWKGVTVRGVKGQTQWIFKQDNNKTKFTYILIYELPIPIISNIIDALFVRPAWQNIVTESLDNLKKIIELNTSR